VRGKSGGVRKLFETSASYKLLLVGLTFIMFNLYIANRQHFAIHQTNPAESFSKFWLTLRRLTRILVLAGENLFDLADIVFCHAALHFHDLLMTPLQKPFSPRHCTALRALQCR
jgi:hypothetical protein